jgi:hypothetical protein
MIEDVSLRTVAVNWIGENQGPGGSSSGNSTSLLVWVPNKTVSAQIISSLSDLSYWGYDFDLGADEYQIAPWSCEWNTSAGIVRYIQFPGESTFLQGRPSTIEHIPNCVAVQFTVSVGVFPDGSQPQGDVNASISALATATIFIES